ncbi:YebC/PmpR family DNA-binding transcriptional regulator [bacterium]|jgi:YebC/PmpR family DNA-binding regulatory protein|nr:YebC/PmpR family DNA-binding transcriptional regulator [bacterium]MBT4649063.1 YebC/PmpR family DNA-binding transcriptional regulator [bacterium]
MSGHSKWSTIKRAKDIKDAKRSNLFTKLSKNIAVAARGNPDVDTNFKLRMAIDKAKGLSMPRDNIERAVKKAAGVSGEGAIDSLLYEAYGPEGVAIIIDVLTDNKNRTVSNIKHIITKCGGNLGNSGSVLWMFEMKGEIALLKPELDDDQELAIIEAGAEDIIRHDQQIIIITNKDELSKLKDKLQTLDLETSSADIVYLAKEKVPVKDEERLLKILEALDDDDDVNNVYTNADI